MQVPASAVQLVRSAHAAPLTSQLLPPPQFPGTGLQADASAQGTTPSQLAPSVQKPGTGFVFGVQVAASAHGAPRTSQGAPPLHVPSRAGNVVVPVQIVESRQGTPVMMQGSPLPQNPSLAVHVKPSAMQGKRGVPQRD